MMQGQMETVLTEELLNNLGCQDLMHKDRSTLGVHLLAHSLRV